MRLDALALNVPARVRSVHAQAANPEWPQLLADIGFTPGEPVRVLHRAVLGGDPLVVRVGAGTFALRRAEAAQVEVEPLEERAA